MLGEKGWISDYKTALSTAGFKLEDTTALVRKAYLSLEGTQRERGVWPVELGRESNDRRRVAKSKRRRERSGIAQTKVSDSRLRDLRCLPEGKLLRRRPTPSRETLRAYTRALEALAFFDRLRQPDNLCGED